MGIKRFFKKVGNWVKDKFHKAKNVVSKFAKPVLRVGKKVIDFVGKTPIAPIIDKVTHGAFSIAKGISNLIPDGNVKENANKFIVDTIECARNFQYADDFSNLSGVQIIKTELTDK